MFKPLTALAVIAALASFAMPAHGCDMHGAGYGGFGSGGAHWKPFSPAPNRTKYVAPDLKAEQTAMPKPLVETPPAKKARPRFSNAASRAALAAKKTRAQKSSTFAHSAQQPL